jgi:hypothetical protein
MPVIRRWREWRARWAVTVLVGDHGAVGPVWLRAAALAAQDGDLLPEHQDFCVLGCVAAGQQGQPPEEPDHEQVDQADDHEHRA